jgi:2-haloacid dehalogenase
VRPRLLTFDIFGTVLDWRRGLREATAAAGAALDDAAFDRVIDAQAVDEAGPFRTYAEITARSLIGVLGMAAGPAASIAAAAGTWPLYPDSRDALRRLRSLVPCAATTNSDRTHGEQVQSALGFRLHAWICAEEVGVYKPDPRVWLAASARLGVEPGPWWWHVSAYVDYDLETARSLGLTCVYVRRPHARPGPTDLAVKDLAELADRVAGAFSAAATPRG